FGSRLGAGCADAGRTARVNSTSAAGQAGWMRMVLLRGGGETRCCLNGEGPRAIAPRTGIGRYRVGANFTAGGPWNGWRRGTDSGVRPGTKLFVREILSEKKLANRAAKRHAMGQTVRVALTRNSPG